MHVHDFDEEYKVYVTALDRMVKQVSEDIYDVFHVTNVEDMKVLTINTIDLSELTVEEINHHIKDCGLKFNEGKIVQAHDENEVVEDREHIIDYVLADRLSISGLINDAVKYDFENAIELNELLLEHDIPVRYSKHTLESI